MRQAEYAVRDSERLSDRDPDRDEARPERDGPQGRSGQEHTGPGSMDRVRLRSARDDRKPGRCCPTNPDQQERVPRAGSGTRAPLHASPVQDHCAAGGGQALKTRTALTAGGQTQASARTGSPDLVLADIFKAFGGVRAVDGANLECYPGEVHGLIGENGAGKSTLIKILSGVFPADAGDIRLRGELLAPRTPAEAASSSPRSLMSPASAGKTPERI